jgi:hypothetical protein
MALENEDQISISLQIYAMIRLYHRNTAIGVKSIPFNQQCNIPWRLGISWLSNLFLDGPVEK